MNFDLLNIIKPSHSLELTANNQVLKISDVLSQELSISLEFSNLSLFESLVMSNRYDDEFIQALASFLDASAGSHGLCFINKKVYNAPYNSDRCYRNKLG